jgi:chitodextrinase
MTKNYLLSLIFVVAMILPSFSQENKPGKPIYVGKISSVEYVTSIKSRPNDMLPSDDSFKEAKDKKSFGNLLTPGKDPQTQDDYFVRNRNSKEQTVRMPNPNLVFDAYASNSQPTDPSLAIGPNHVFVVYNTGFTIYDKSGNQLLGQTAPNPAIFPNAGCCDLTVSYDNVADRWVLSFLGNGAQVAVSDGPDPLTAGWFVYNIPAITDYQKLSVWTDGYYLTQNTGSSTKIWVLDRAALLAGSTSAGVLGFQLPGIVTSGFHSPQALNVSDDNLPTGPATIVYQQDDAWTGVSNDHVKYWTIDIDWNNTSNSTVSAATEIPVTPFIGVFDNGSFSNLRQPGGGRPINIDALQATVMNQAQFRKFSTHNSAIFNFVVDVDASSAKLAAVRWLEFRQSGDGQPWSLYQEGTYTAPDNRHAWNASLIMDGSGNIGMGYTSMSSESSSSTVQVSSYYTGRLATDPLGTMTMMEGLIANGNGKIPGTRYGDYSKIDIDPVNDQTFWFITEYVNSSRRGVVGSFDLQAPVPDTEAPTNPTNLTASNITSTGATLTWTASTDNVGVTQYNVFIDGSLVGTTSTTSFNVTGLSPLTAYTADISAQDAAGNTSGNATTNFTTTDSGDTQAPTIPTNLSASNITSSGATLTWTASTDNVGVSQYNVFIDGGLVGTTSNTTFDVTGLTASTSYTAEVNAQDAAGNTSANASTNFTTTGGGTGPGQIAAYFFETGFDGWIDGGNDCARVQSGNSFEGLFSIRLRDDSNSSNMVSPVLDLSGNTQVTFEFNYYPNSMENGEDFFVEFFNGSSYQVIGQYVSGTDFSNGSFFVDTITLDAANFNFNANNRFRIRLDASANNDQVFFDQIIVSGDNVGSGQAQANVERSVSFNAMMEESIKVFPNPASSTLNIRLENDIEVERVLIFSYTGQLVKTLELNQEDVSIDISRLASGMYFARFENKSLAFTKRFIKK